MQEYSNEQIRVGKRLVAWLIGKGLQREPARAIVKGILLSNSLKAINNAMTQVNCTSLENLRKILSHNKK